MEKCEGKTKCEMLVMCRFRWVSILQKVLCKTSVPSLCKNEVSKSLGGEGKIKVITGNRNGVFTVEELVED